MRPAFLKAVRHAGAVPVILPLDLEEEDLALLLKTADGVLFTGGPDVHPFSLEKKPSTLRKRLSSEGQMEFSLLKLAMAARKPILGVCRGAQVLNIGLGGDIYQDIPSQFPQKFPVAHTQPFGYEIPSHTVTVTPGTLLAEISQCDTLKVNSMHHQAVRTVAPGLIAPDTARRAGRMCGNAGISLPDRSSVAPGISLGAGSGCLPPVYSLCKSLQRVRRIDTPNGRSESCSAAPVSPYPSIYPAFSP